MSAAMVSLKEFHLLPLFILCLLVVVSNASLPSEDYWHSKLPNTPIPYELQKLMLPSANVGDKNTYWDMNLNIDQTSPEDGNDHKNPIVLEGEDLDDRRRRYGRRYDEAFTKSSDGMSLEDLDDRRRRYGRRYDEAFTEGSDEVSMEDLDDRRRRYGRRYDEAFTEGSDGVSMEDLDDRRRRYGRRYDEAFTEGSDEVSLEDLDDRRRRYGRRYDENFKDGLVDKKKKYGKIYDEAFTKTSDGMSLEDLDDRRRRYGRRYRRTYDKAFVGGMFNKHALPNSTVFFFQDDLRTGKKMKLHITKSFNKAKFLPRQVAESLPFSTLKLQKILQMFSVEPGTLQAKLINQTLDECESPGIKGEDRYCPTSLESFINFAISHVGNKSRILYNEIAKPTRMQEYTIIKAELVGENQVVCHKVMYPYAVYYCHFVNATKVYMAELVGTNGIKAKAVAVCHSDTSDWHPQHLAFLMLNVKPGDGTVCHFIRSDTLVWVSNEVRTQPLNNPNLLATN